MNITGFGVEDAFVALTIQDALVGRGGATTSAITFAAETAGDFTTEIGGATLGIIYAMLGA